MWEVYNVRLYEEITHLFNNPLFYQWNVEQLLKLECNL